MGSGVLASPPDMWGAIKGSFEMEEIFGLLNEHRETFIAGASALVAVIAAVFSSRETRKQRNILKETLRQRVDEASVAWGNEAIDALAEAEGLVSFNKIAGFTQKPERVKVAQELSALADRGRLFFPNSETGKKGTDKEGAFRGSRAPILEALIFAHFELKATEEGEAGQADYINRCRRLFVSELQAHIDPAQRDLVVGRYDSRRKERRQDAARRASVLQAELYSRRPHLAAADDAESQSDD